MYMFARRWPCNDTYLDTSFLSGVELGDDGNPTGPLGPTILFEAANTEFEQDVEVREPCLLCLVRLIGLVRYWSAAP